MSHKRPQGLPVSSFVTAQPPHERGGRPLSKLTVSGAWGRGALWTGHREFPPHVVDPMMVLLGPDGGCLSVHAAAHRPPWRMGKGLQDPCPHRPRSCPVPCVATTLSPTLPPQGGWILLPSLPERLPCAHRMPHLSHLSLTADGPTLKGQSLWHLQVRKKGLRKKINNLETGDLPASRPVASTSRDRPAPAPCHPLSAPSGHHLSPAPTSRVLP